MSALQGTTVNVSIHAPTWGATTFSDLISRLNGFQSTRPRGARRRGQAGKERHGAVSIHAPTWGATFERFSSYREDDVSIHAPTWGATDYYPGGAAGLQVSIHAPTWGATGRLSRRKRLCESFNPRAHVGRDAPTAQNLTRPHEFQSTRPRGARLPPQNFFKMRYSFNPRAHVGRDSN